ncbi:hypothetical protein GCM10009193_16070 [Shewanella aestuarii]|nr:hypothetical protein GCM10009193_16070 [Shewanella aestuarii]
MFVALASLTWAIWPALALMFDDVNVMRIYTSTLNSVFLLLAAAFFEYGPRRLRLFQLHERWVWMVICGGLVVASVTSNIDNRYWKYIPDVILSSLTLTILGWAICVTFYQRISKQAALIAGTITLYALFAQMLEITHLFTNAQWQPPSEARLIISLTSKILLLMVLLLVAISWLQEQWLAQVTENSLSQLPKNQIDIHITGRRDPDNQRRWLVSVQQHSSTKDEPVMRSLTSVPHLLLIQFSLRKQLNAQVDGGMMNTVEDSFYHADLNKIHKMLGLNVPTIFKNFGRNGCYAIRNNINVTLNEQELAKDPDVLGLMKKEQQKLAAVAK